MEQHALKPQNKTGNGELQEGHSGWKVHNSHERRESEAQGGGGSIRHIM